MLDPRGGGQSDKPTGQYSIEQMADDVAGLFDTLGIASADVVGYSMGGKIALQLAAGHPELVDHLILGATAARPSVTRRFSRRWFMMDLVSRIPMLRKADGQPSYAFEAQRQASKSFDGRGLLLPGEGQHADHPGHGATGLCQRAPPPSSRRSLAARWSICQEGTSRW